MVFFERVCETLLLAAAGGEATEPVIFLERFYIVLLLTHLIAAGVLAGSMTHNLLIVWKYIRGKFGRKKRELYFAKVSLWSYVIVYLFGCLIYPAFRVYFRAAYFDVDLSWATGLFEVKEHWGSLGLAMFFVYYFLRKSFEPDVEKDKLWLYVPLCLILNVIVWYKIIVGCYLSLLKGSF